MNDKAILGTPDIAITASLEERLMIYQRISGVPIILQYCVYPSKNILWCAG